MAASSFVVFGFVRSFLEPISQVAALHRAVLDRQLVEVDGLHNMTPAAEYRASIGVYLDQAIFGEYVATH